MNPEISIVTLTHNKLEVTRRCLPSLLKTKGSSSWELIVVDNGSTDGTTAWLETFRIDAGKAGINVTVIGNPGNMGCSTARNQGIDAAEGAFITFIDNDVALRTAHWLDRLSGVFNDTPDTGIVGPRIVYPTPPHLIQCAGVGISRNGRVLFRGRGKPRETPELSCREPVQALISACFMTRAETLARYGGFDEAFNPVEFEDFDLCYRIRESGLQAIYEPSVEMYHLESVTTQGTESIPNAALIIRNGMTFKRRWHKMFSREHGPDDTLTPWKKIPPTDLNRLGEMPVIQER